MQFVLPAEDTPAETKQSQDPPPIYHGDELYFDGKEDNELERDDIELNIIIFIFVDDHIILLLSGLMYSIILLIQIA